MINTFFNKDINRNIETVVKADDQNHISDEVAEYVITKEIATKITDLFDEYIEYSGANGVWISGFFGSGKSHLLKILSYVFENKEFDGYKSGALFAEKIENDDILKSNVILASKIPSESILFNIDQHAQITSKGDPNAILSVFYKVFFEHLGYYGFMPHVAKFEMWLDHEDKYDLFKQKFQAAFGKSWQAARINYFDPEVTDTIAVVLGGINHKSADKYEDILDEIEDRNKQSIENFAQLVQDYIQTKPKDFRLNFFVDEVGQYISDNTKLMLNLQTIAETLATKTNGRSWVLVTSQEDMEKVVGDMGKKQQNDFSRIQARFRIKVPLTSANVDEVIEKRLLKKKTDVQYSLEKMYEREGNHLTSLLSFSSEGIQFRGYTDDLDFANKFPMAPYQFNLFQQCRMALSLHNAFQGKHASVGERSMLGVFQQVIKAIGHKDQNALVSFDLMYEGIKNELRTEIINSVQLAENNLDNLFAIQVLKALFLVKYFNNFKTTKRNISVLLIDDIKIDIKKHEQQIDIALNLLENQSYIQRNGDFYEFLTSDEKDIEQEIKNTDIPQDEITQELKTIFFDNIISGNKIKFANNQYEYDFRAIIDGIEYGRERELEVEIITPNSSSYQNELVLKANTMGSNRMKLMVKPHLNFIKDVRLFLQTQKYAKQNRSTSNTAEQKRILQDKGLLNSERRKNLVLIAKQILAEATVFMNGATAEIGQTADAKTRVIKAFQILVSQVYSNLKMIGNISYDENSFRTLLRSTSNEMFNKDSDLSEAEFELLNFIKRQKTSGERTSLLSIKKFFTHKPYGWYPNAIWTQVAKLFKRGKIEIVQGANHLERQDVIEALLKSSQHETTLLIPQIDFNNKDVSNLKKVYKEAFDQSCALKEPKEVGNAFKAKIIEMQTEVSQLLNQKNEIYFLKGLEPLNVKLKALAKKDYSYFINHLKDFEDDLLNNKEDVLDPIKKFLNGDQYKIFKDCKQFITGNNANLDYIKGEDHDTLVTLISSEKPYKDKSIKHAKAAKDALDKKIKTAIEFEKEKASKILDTIEQDVLSSNDFDTLPAQYKEEIKTVFLTKKKKIEQERFIASIKNSANDFKDGLYSEQMNSINKFKILDTGIAAETAPKYIKKSSIRVNFNKRELTTQQDVEAYIEALKAAYLQQIEQQLKITL